MMSGMHAELMGAPGDGKKMYTGSSLFVAYYVEFCLRRFPVLIADYLSGSIVEVNPYR